MVTVVATTIVSFLPVFFLTGRDYKLFSPLAFTKTFAIAAATITAARLFPLSRRLMLHTANDRKSTALAAGLGFAGLMSATAHFLWGAKLADYWPLPGWLLTGGNCRPAFGVGWQLLRERIRRIQDIPLSRFGHRIYAARCAPRLTSSALSATGPIAGPGIGCLDWNADRAQTGRTPGKRIWSRP